MNTMNMLNAIYAMTIQTPRKISLFEHLLVAAFLLAVAAVFVWLIKREIQQRGTGKRILCEAVVVSKSADKHVSQPVFMQGRYPGVGLVESEMLYSVLFRTEEGSELRFPAGKVLYDQLSEGQKGTLTYKGSRLIQFGHYLNESRSRGAAFKGIHGEL